MEDPGHPVVNVFVPAITHRRFRLLLMLPDPALTQETEQAPHPPQLLHVGQPGFRQLSACEEDPGHKGEATGFPSKIHCLDRVRAELLPHVSEQEDHPLQDPQVGHAGRVHDRTLVSSPTHLMLGYTVYFKMHFRCRVCFEDEPQLAEHAPHEDQFVHTGVHSLHRSFCTLSPIQSLAILLVPFSWQCRWRCVVQLLHSVQVDHSMHS